MKKILILLFYFTSCVSLCAQVNKSKIGYYFDIEGESIEEFYDLDYEPKKSLERIFNVGAEFTPGYFYSSDGRKSDGFIKYLQNNLDFKFKASLQDKPTTINASQCLGFVIGIDSFATINYTDIVGQSQMPFTRLQLFVEVIEEAGSLSFFKQFNTNASFTEVLYYVKYDSSDKYLIFPRKRNDFKDMALEVFGSSEHIVKRIKSGEYTIENMFTIIKLYKYKILSDLQVKQYFNSSFNEVRGYQGSVYQSTVELQSDSVYRITYYEINGTKIFEGRFTSFKPTIKDGEFIYYYPNGTIRKRLFFEKNKAIKRITYYQSGRKHREFSTDERKYESVYDINGTPVLNSLGNGEESLYDSINSRELYYQYSEHKLTSVYFIDDTRTKVYQYCQNNAKINSFMEIERAFNEKIVYPTESIKKNDYGIVLLRCQIDPDGKISKPKIIKGVDPAIDQSVLNFMPYLKGYHALETGKVNRERVHQEVVIPFEFSLIGFSRTSMYNSKFWLLRGGGALHQVLIKGLLR